MTPDTLQRAIATAGDVSFWCRNAEHGDCDGALREATGHHWFCACLCHLPVQPDPDNPDHQKAFTIWSIARAALIANVKDVISSLSSDLDQLTTNVTDPP